MHVLIVVPDAILGTILKFVVASATTKVRVLSIPQAGSGAIDWTEGDEPMTLPEAINEAEMIIISHPDTDVMLEVRKQAGNKILLGVFTESAIPVSSISLDLFQEMWPEIARALRARLEKDS